MDPRPTDEPVKPPLSLCQSVCVTSFQCLYHISKKKLDEVYFLHADKHLSFLQVDFVTLGIQISPKVMLLLFIGMIKHSQSTQSNKFAIPLQYLKKEIWNGVQFSRVDKH